MKMKFTPFFTFEIDAGEKAREKMEELFRRVDYNN
jgi:ribosome-binding factor A